MSAEDPALSPREIEVLGAYRREWSWKRAAASLGISARTAQMHGDSARRKLGARTIGEAIALARQAD